MTSAGAQSDALQQIRGNEGAEHHGSLTRPSTDSTNVAHSGRGDGLMDSLRPPAACSQAGYIRCNGLSGENFEQGA